MPSGNFGAGTVPYYLINGVMACVGGVLVMQYLTTVRLLRKVVLSRREEIPTWTAAPSGPVWRFFGAFFVLVLPLALIPLGVSFARTVRGGLSVSDPITLVNIVSLPLTVVLLLALPIVATGLPSRLRRQRNALEAKIIAREARIHSLLATANEEDAERHFRTLTELVQRRLLLHKEHPVWPLPASAPRKLALTAVPAILSAILGIIEFLRTIADGFQAME